MADFISRIGNVPPTYPVRPIKPPGKDEKSGEEQRRRQDDAPGDDNHDADDDESPRHIDEHV